VQDFMERFDRLEQDHRRNSELLIEVNTNLKHVMNQFNVLNDRIDKREAEIEALELRVKKVEQGLDHRLKNVENLLSEYKGSLLMAKVFGGILAIVITALEVYNIYTR